MRERVPEVYTTKEKKHVSDLIGMANGLYELGTTRTYELRSRDSIFFICFADFNKCITNFVVYDFNKYITNFVVYQKVTAKMYDF